MEISEEVQKSAKLLAGITVVMDYKYCSISLGRLRGHSRFKQI